MIGDVVGQPRDMKELSKLRDGLGDAIEKLTGANK